MQLEPLWTSDKKKLNEVPKCPNCGAPRQLELQILPQLFDYLSPLHFVDWETICIYTCTNLAKCMPAFDKNEFYVQEFAYIQYSSDFDHVKYGTPEEVAKLRQQAAETEVYTQTEEEKVADEERAKKKAEKNKR